MIWLVGIPYLNMYWLVPRFLFRRKYLSYISLTLSVTIASFFLVFEGGKLLIRPFLIVPVKDEGLSIEGVISFIFAFSILVAASTGIQLLKRWILDSYRFRQLENTRLHSELDQLKSQINPHFLFNMLNNTHVLIREDPNLAAQVVLRLSDLLRYQLYDSAREKVLLSTDIRFLEDFLNLEKIRRDFFHFTITHENIEEAVSIPPFLFITFVENAIKHSMDMETESYVHLGFMMEKEQLIFSCSNSKPDKPMEVHKKQGGIGLANIKRRLDLIYPEKHMLTIKEDSKGYHVHLIIYL